MRKLFKLAGIWITLFSMAVQTTGAASLAMIGSPMAARNMMPLPSMQALQAIPLKAAPAPIKAAPAPKKIAPKVEVPAEWGFYILAFGEIAFESLAHAKSSFNNAMQAARRSANDALKRGAEFLQEKPETPETIAPIDLAAPIPPAQPEQAVPAPLIVMPEAKAAPQQSMLVVREEMPISRSGLLVNPVEAVGVAEDKTEVPEVFTPPLPGRLEPVTLEPEIAKNARAMQTLQGEDAERALAHPINDVKNIRQFPHLNPSKAFAFKMPGLDHRRLNKGVAARMEGSWNQGKGIRFRIVYLNPVGFSQADGAGFKYNMPGKLLENPAEVLPTEYWGNYAIYNHGQTVNYVVEVQNTGTKAIKGMTVVAAQEVFSREGKAGRRLPTEAGVQKIETLNPGETVKLRNQFKITSDWAWHGSLEQTHVLMTSQSGVGGTTETLAEAYQAGLIDPPPDL